MKIETEIRLLELHEKMKLENVEHKREGKNKNKLCLEVSLV